jgi:hypothetical protein
VDPVFWSVLKPSIRENREPASGPLLREDVGRTPAQYRIAYRTKGAVDPSLHTYLQSPRLSARRLMLDALHGI